jgi:hypothetical protein
MEVKMRKEDSLSQVTITIPLESEIIKIYFSDKEMFRSTHYAANTAASVYPFLREVILDSLKGAFKKEEIELIIQLLKLENEAKFVTTSSVLITKIETIANIVKKKLKKEEKEMLPGIIKKIGELDTIRIIVLTEWIGTFINFTSGRKKVKVNLEKYIQQLL